ncbi:uncharacterized protein LOC124392752 [Silurus meridionalis]|uniref:uncharacterized protein LOC124392752 n=1 Tax=Silurus meridionalis TaxID=175797 RepID=UPI001EEB6CDA|nr:uncharacterized protein LOC124392752 [Silurus meridionalis]
MLRSVRTMAPDEAIKTSTLHPQDPGGDDRRSHIPGEASCPTMSTGHIDFFPSALPPPAHDIRLCARPTERQNKAENYENFLPRRPLKLAPIELPVEVQEAQREKIRSIWKEDEKPELGSHGKTLLLPVNQMTVGQRSGKKGQVQTPIQSGHIDIGQSDRRKARRFKIHRAQQLDEDQSKSRFSSED